MQYSILTFFLFFSDHAKLKDHVATMEGQLDAQVQEGGMSFFFVRFSRFSRQIQEYKQGISNE